MKTRIVSLIGVLCMLAPSVYAQEASAPVTVPIAVPPLTSLFFSDEERELITSARTQYHERLQDGPSEADLLDQLRGIKEAETKREAIEDTQYEQFYLESLIYHKPNDWSVWLKTIRGSEKFAPDTVIMPKATLHLVGVNKENATFEWKPRNWSYVVKTFKGENSHILLNTTTKTVTFTLWVNQMLGSHTMTIGEGELPIVAIPDASATTVLTPTNPLPQGSPASNTGATPPPVAEKQPKILDQYNALEGFDQKRP